MLGIFLKQRGVVIVVIMKIQNGSLHKKRLLRTLLMVWTGAMSQINGVYFHISCRTKQKIRSGQSGRRSTGNV